MNTGRVGGPEDDERSKKVRIQHSSAIVKGDRRGHDRVGARTPTSATWSPLGAGHRRGGHRHPPAAAALRGDRPQGGVRRGLVRLKDARAEFLSKFPSLSAEIVDSVHVEGVARPARIRVRVGPRPHSSAFWTRRTVRGDAARLPRGRRRVRILAPLARNVARRSRRPDAERLHRGAGSRTAGPSARQARAGDDRAQARGGAGASALHARRGARPRRSARPAARPPASRRAEGRGGRRRPRAGHGQRAARASEPGAARARLLRGTAQPGGGRPRPRATWTSSRKPSTSGARAARSGSSRSARRRRIGCAIYLDGSRPELARGAEDALFLSARGNRLTRARSGGSSPTRTGCATRSPRTCSRAAQTCA